MENIKEGLKATSEKAKELGSSASKESNKAKMENPDRSIGERVGGGIDAAKDKMRESGHAASKEAHKQKATH